MCKKIENRIECTNHGYPYSEALYPDDPDQPLSCNSTQEEIDKHIAEVERLKSDISQHYWDCKCMICR